jgi:hypothetical protein
MVQAVSHQTLRRNANLVRDRRCARICAHAVGAEANRPLNK